MEDAEKPASRQVVFLSVTEEVGERPRRSHDVLRQRLRALHAVVDLAIAERDGRGVDGEVGNSGRQQG